MQQTLIEDMISNGVINLDKPRGPTSHEVTAWVKHLLGINKAGHTGTLDPHVSGVLPVALGKATSAVQAMHLASKEYIFILRFHAPVDKSTVDEVFSNFRGEIFQVPPLRSAVARKGRIRTIYEMEILESEGMDYLIRVKCDAGTYIRTLCKDIGLASGAGANMRELRRIASGCFHERESVTLHDLSTAVYAWRVEKDERYLRRIILPPSTLFAHLKKVIIKDSAVDAICHGAQLMIPGIESITPGIAKGEHIAIMTGKDEVVALAVTVMGEREFETMKRGIFARVLRVYMPRGVYPRGWKSRGPRGG